MTLLGNSHASARPSYGTRRARPLLEPLEARVLMAVNFTGDVLADFPVETPGVSVLVDGPTVRHPTIPSVLGPLIQVSGLDVSGIRMQYTPEDDTLSIGLVQPTNPKTGKPVLAGDTDNNGNNGTVDPAVLQLLPQFVDFAPLGGPETMGAFLDLDNDGVDDIVAGVPLSSGGATFTVADALSQPLIAPGFGTARPANTGGFFLANDPDHPGFEFRILKFSALYSEKTGRALTPNSPIRVGAFGRSFEDSGISEGYFPAQPVSLFFFANGPSAATDAYQTDKLTPLNVTAASGVLANDLGDSIRVIGSDETTELGARAFVNPDGSLLYDPASSETLRAIAPDETVVDTFTYTIRDSGGKTSVATVRVEVAGLRDASRTNVSVTIASPVEGQQVVLTASVAAIAGQGTPTGTVEFLDGTTSLGTTKLDATGNATLTLTGLAPGSRSITAAYRGSATFAPSGSRPTSLAIGYANPTVSASNATLNRRKKGQITLVFGGAVDQTAAATASNYVLTLPTRRGPGRRISVTATFDPSSRTVRLTLPGLLTAGARYRLTVRGAVRTAPGASNAAPDFSASVAVAKGVRAATTRPRALN